MSASISDNLPTEYVQDQGDTEPQLPAAKGSFLVEFIKKMSAGELYRISVPVILLTNKSILEKFSEYFSPNEFLHYTLRPESTAEERMKGVSLFLLSGLKTWPKNRLFGTKPFNPVLGETFKCWWEDGSKFVAEQVGHHPPATAFHLEGKDRSYILRATVHGRGKFYGNSVGIFLEGMVRMELPAFNEVYEISLPSLLSRGLLLGTQAIEVGDALTVDCEATGLRMKLNFDSKKGEIRVKGSLTRIDSEEKLYSYEGPLMEQIMEWKGEGSKKQRKAEPGTVFFDAAKAVNMQKRTRKMEEMEDLESRKVWHAVAEAMAKNDYEAAGKEKDGVEQRQREHLEKHPESEFKPRFFHVQEEGGSHKKYFLNTEVTL